MIDRNRKQSVKKVVHIINDDAADWPDASRLAAIADAVVETIDLRGDDVDYELVLDAILAADVVYCV